jgi:gamma-glutamyltranspeptidase/glutathione hydrolase
MLALEAAKAHGGRVPLSDLLAAAIKQARDGVEVSRHLALNIADASRELKDVPGFAASFLIDGKPPPQGARLHPKALAETLEKGASALTARTSPNPAIPNFAAT